MNLGENVAWNIKKLDPYTLENKGTQKKRKKKERKKKRKSRSKKQGNSMQKQFNAFNEAGVA